VSEAEAEFGRDWPSSAMIYVLINLNSFIIYRIAEDKWYSRLTANSKRNFSEMGLVQISIVVYTGKTGNLNVDM
jgi:hypothetical protein